MGRITKERGMEERRREKRKDQLFPRQTPLLSLKLCGSSWQFLTKMSLLPRWAAPILPLALDFVHPRAITLPLALSCVAFPLHTFQDHVVSPPTHRCKGKCGSEVGISGEDWNCSAEPFSSAYNDLFYFEFFYRVLMRKQKSTPNFDR